MRFFFDFDDVLVNTRDICRDYFSLFEDVGVSAKEGEALYQKMKAEVGRDDPKVFARLLGERLSFVSEAECLGRFLEFKSRTREYVFSDSAKALRYFRDLGSELFVVSTGDAEGQKIKIHTSGLEEYFTAICIVSNDAEKAGEIRRFGGGEGDVFFDDKTKVLEGVKRDIPELFAVQVLRHEKVGRAGVANAWVSSIQEFIDTYSQLFEK